MSVTIDHIQIRPARYAPGSRKGKGGRPKKTEAEKRARKSTTQRERREHERQPFIRNGKRRRTPRNFKNTLEGLSEKWTKTLTTGSYDSYRLPAMDTEEATRWAAILSVMDQTENDLRNDLLNLIERTTHGGDSYEKKPANSVRLKGAGPDSYDRESEDDRFERDPLKAITALNWKIDGGDGEW